MQCASVGGVKEADPRGRDRAQGVGEVSVLCLICRMALRSTDIVAVLALLCVLVAAYAALKWP
jgi:hypothetical protein